MGMQQVEVEDLNGRRQPIRPIGNGRVEKARKVMAGTMVGGTMKDPGTTGSLERLEPNKADKK